MHPVPAGELLEDADAAHAVAMLVQAGEKTATPPPPGTMPMIPPPTPLLAGMPTE